MDKKRKRLEEEPVDDEVFEPITDLRPEDIVNRKIEIKFKERDPATNKLCIASYYGKVIAYEPSATGQLEKTKFIILWKSDENEEEDYLDIPDKLDLIKDFRNGDARFLKRFN